MNVELFMWSLWLEHGKAYKAFYKHLATDYLYVVQYIKYTLLQDELTPLLMAAIKGSADVIPLLVQSGADLNLKDAVR